MATAEQDDVLLLLLLDEEQEQERLSEISSLSSTQEIILSLLNIFSGSMSMIGSSLIIYLVATNTRKTPYKRIMVGLSACDVLASLTYAISPFLLPKDTSYRVWASGNSKSCSLLGFLTQFSFSAVWYNGALSYYYLLTVRFGVKTTQFARRYEPIIHILCIGYNLITACIGVSIELFQESELGMTCWIAEYPEGCEVNGDCTGATIGWFFGGLPVVFIFLSIVINNLIIYYFVKATINRGRQSSLRGNQHQTRRINAVATQALYYVGSFFLAYTWAFSVKVLESFSFEASNEANIFPLLVLQAFLLPLQGVFNLFVYTRPNYIRVRQEHPEETRLWSLQRTWFNNNTPSSRLSSVDASIGSIGMNRRASSKLVLANLSSRPKSNISLVENGSTATGASGGGAAAAATGGTTAGGNGFDATAMRLRASAEFSSAFSPHNNHTNHSNTNRQQQQQQNTTVSFMTTRDHQTVPRHHHQIPISSRVIKEEESGELSSSQFDPITISTTADAAAAATAKKKKKNSPPVVIRKVRLNEASDDDDDDDDDLFELDIHDDNDDKDDALSEESSFDEKQHDADENEIVSLGGGGNETDNNNNNNRDDQGGDAKLPPNGEDVQD